MNKHTKTIIEMAFALVIMIATCYLLCKSCEYQRDMNDLKVKCERYINLKNQYDTTTQYNKVVLFNKMMEITDSIQNEE